MGTLFSKEAHYRKALESLESLFGEITMESALMKWDFSDYYREEMGEPLYRRFIFFRKLIEQDRLAHIKVQTNEIEKSLSSEQKRTVNLDPGYLTPAKIVLASTKDYSHRIYLGEGIYGEVTLLYKRGCFIPHVNTYKDYQGTGYVRLFVMARILLSLLAKGEVSSGFCCQK